ncbi:MAG: asnB, partial [Anaerocolumna sp.]|nr:asnB [Anaerocolumna sp.]
MCGICGIIGKPITKSDVELVGKMNEMQKHRGPDDEGIYQNDNIVLGHRRLSILDLSSAGHQPMSYMDKYVISYNGEVYNYLELREILIKEGYTFKSNTDTEVIMAAYDKWGVECFNKFNGFW